MGGGSAAKIGGMDARRCVNWMHRLHVSGPEGLIDNWPEGPEPRVSAERLAQFAQIVEAGPAWKDGVVRSCRIDVKRVIAERFGVRVSCSLCRKAFREVRPPPHRARPRHPIAGERIVEAREKKIPCALKAHLEGLPETTPVEIWFEDEARIGQKTALSVNGPDGERDRGSQPISATTTSISSARCAQPAASGQPWRRPMQTPT